MSVISGVLAERAEHYPVLHRDSADFQWSEEFGDILHGLAIGNIGCAGRRVLGGREVGDAFRWDIDEAVAFVSD